MAEGWRVGAAALKRMVAFRDIAMHDDQSLLLPFLVKVITLHLGEFLEFTRIVLKRDAAENGGQDQLRFDERSGRKTIICVPGASKRNSLS